ncbi:MAG: ABC transporter ATP-binding protein [Gemmatimonadetes bacterium]|nr:ABC transporter ATP-binding protein [Gemmatimonadota bacterium]
MIGSAGDILLKVSDLQTYFPFGGRWIGRQRWVRAVDGVSLIVKRGEVLGLVGESGSGKTTLGRSVLRLIEPTGGSVQFDGIDVLGLSGVEMRKLRKRMQVVFQDPYKSLSPRMQIGQIIAEPIRLHSIVPEDSVEDRVVELLGKVGLETYFRHRYPHEMSGGQRQRIAIARALALEPDFIVADEPVSALDVSVQAQILNILLELQRTEGIAMLMISHDLAVVERVANRIAVMYRGKIVEVADAGQLIDTPLHPYTQALISAVPTGRPGKRKPRVRLPAETSLLGEPIKGCPFAPRCPEVQGICRQVMPKLERKYGGHEAACHVR